MVGLKSLGQGGIAARLRAIGIALGLLLLAVWIHDPRGLHFKADDYPTIAYARNLGNVLHDFFGPQYDLNFFVFHRPLITLSLWQDFFLFGVKPLGFFSMNLLAFVLSLVLLQRIMALFLGGWRGDVVGLVLALLWLFHPVPIASLEWVVGRVDTHVVPWILGAVFFHLRARRGGARWPVWVCTILGLLTKESAFGIPFLLLGVDLLDSSIRLPKVREQGSHVWNRFPSLGLLVLIPLDLLFRWVFLGQLLGGYGFLKAARLDVPAIFSGLANTLSLSLVPRDTQNPLLQWGLPVLLLLGLFWFCFRERGSFFSRMGGIALVGIGLFGPLALLLPSMRDPANQRYAYLACLGPWLALLTFVPMGGEGKGFMFSPILLLGLLGLVPAQKREQKRMAVHDRFVIQTVSLLRKAAELERGKSQDLPLVLSGRAEAACHPQRFLWGLGSVLRSPFVREEGLQRQVISLRTLHPSALPVPEKLAGAGLGVLVRVRENGTAVQLIPKKPEPVREAQALGFRGRLGVDLQDRARVLGDRGPGFALGPKFERKVALCTSLGSFLLRLPPRPRTRLTLWELLTTPIRSEGAPLPGLWILWNAFDLCPDEPLQMFWREGGHLVHARLWVERAFTKRMAKAAGGAKK